MDDAPHRMVQFLISDLVHPHPARVLMEMFQHGILEGEVAASTTDGQSPYLVVRVPGLKEPVIVPLDKTQPVELAGCGPRPLS